MRRTLVVALVLGVTGLTAAAPPTRGEIVKASKPSVALIEQTHNGRRQNTAAVAVTADGYFLTTSQALPVLNVPDPKYTLVVLPGEEGQKELTATVVRRDDDLGLVLLKADTKDQLRPLALADADPAEKDELILITCPNPRGRGEPTTRRWGWRSPPPAACRPPTNCSGSTRRQWCSASWAGRR